ncbi:TetR/AcrR family transcriptional regulator [Jongsikchunia kroppenstedtii]|uniref:TetR/AcrR family transcriptional regulator n=1 Tax=Jongsikchunia kroppenstedtii TaxID=1121721 RepID=UPI0005BAB700|nr:TetR/AcrR family transcriptional regulator [Jongsikchunia kroppenstedtii]
MSRLSLPDRRAQLAESALALAERRGLAAVTVRAVAEEAGVSLGVVHYCFEDKEELVAAMIERIIAEALDVLLGSIDTTQQGTGLDALSATLDSTLSSLFHTVAQIPNRWLLVQESMLFSLRQPDESASADQARQQQGFAEKFGYAYLVEMGQRTQTSWNGDEKKIARVALQTIFGTFQWWLIDRDDEAALKSLAYLGEWIAGTAQPASA